jgi:hypothetical protein
MLPKALQLPIPSRECLQPATGIRHSTSVGSLSAFAARNLSKELKISLKLAAVDVPVDIDPMWDADF